MLWEFLSLSDFYFVLPLQAAVSRLKHAGLQRGGDDVLLSTRPRHLSSQQTHGRPQAVC